MTIFVLLNDHMKNLIYLTAALVLFASCKKDNPDNERITTAKATIVYYIEFTNNVTNKEYYPTGSDQMSVTYKTNSGNDTTVSYIGKSMWFNSTFSEEFDLGKGKTAGISLTTNLSTVYTVKVDIVKLTSSDQVSLLTKSSNSGSLQGNILVD